MVIDLSNICLPVCPSSGFVGLDDVPDRIWRDASADGQAVHGHLVDSLVVDQLQPHLMANLGVLDIGHLFHVLDVLSNFVFEI